MRITSQTRRTAALMAASTIGLSTLVLGATGVASAVGPDINYTNAANTTVTIPTTVCAVAWDVSGAAGGDAGSMTGGLGDEITVTTSVTPGSTLLIQPGQRGSSSGAGGTSGAAASGGSGGTGAAGGGGASIVRNGSTTSSPVLVLAAGGGGAGTGSNGGEGESDGFSFTSSSTFDYTGGQGALESPGAGGTRDVGAPGTNGAAGAALVGGSGPAGAGGGGGGESGGGSGASDGTDGSGGGGGSSLPPYDEMNAGHDDPDPTWETASSSTGSVQGTYVPCSAPYGYLPGYVTGEAGDESISVEVSNLLEGSGDPRAVTWTGWQITTDNGANWSTISNGGGYGTGAFTAVVNGLTNGQAYSVKVRPTSIVGPGEASDAMTLTPTHLAAAPANVRATVGASSVHITWDAPVGETGITGYSAWVLPGSDPQSDSGLVECPALDAGARECTVIVPAGTVYTAGVVALNPARGDWGTVVTGVVPAPSAPNTVPTADGPLSTPTGAPSGLAQGSSVTLTGSGYAPNSTVSVYIYSTPTLLGTVVTDGTGSFSKAFTIPATLAPGSHHLVSAGVDASGNPRYLTSAVTVAQASGSLAWTGFETLPVLGAGVVLVGAGAGLVVTARRRRTA